MAGQRWGKHMGLVEVLRVLRRHWLALIVLLLATAGAVGYVYEKVPLSYQSTADMIVLPPNTAGADGSGPAVKINPYAGLGAQSTQVMASALAQLANGRQFLENERDRGVNSTVSVQVATLYGGGVVLTMTATSPHPASLTGDLRVVSQLISAELQQRQQAAGAPAGSLLTMNDLTLPTPPQALSSDRTKLVIVSVVIGLIVSASMVTILESMRRRRADRRARRLAESRSSGEPPATRSDVPADEPVLVRTSAAALPDPSSAARPRGWSDAGAAAR